MSSIERAIDQHPLPISKLYKVFTFTAYNSKMLSIKRAIHQYPLLIIKTLYSLYFYSV